MSCVLDASMAVSFVLDDEFTAKSKRALTLVAASGAVVPTLWDFEVLNALRSAEARGRLSPSALRHAVRGLQGLPIERVVARVDGVALISLARDLELSVYDAAYLSLAIEADLPLATLDVGLVDAAKAAGVALVR